MNLRAPVVAFAAVAAVASIAMIAAISGCATESTLHSMSDPNATYGSSADDAGAAVPVSQVDPGPAASEPAETAAGVAVDTRNLARGASATAEMGAPTPTTRL